MLAVHDRISALNAEYSSDTASAALLMCDRHDPAKTAFTIVHSGGSDAVSYGVLASDSKKLASALKLMGVGPGDRVATLLRKGPELITIMLAVWRLGAVYVPLFTAFASVAIEFRLSAARAKVVITDPGQRHKLNHVGPAWQIILVGGSTDSSDARYEDLIAGSTELDTPSYVQGGGGAVVHIFTSGTTGSPKGVIHPLAYLAGWHSYLEFAVGVADDDVYWCAADPGWAYGLYAGVMAPLAAGTGTLLQVGSFDPTATWNVIDRYRVTNFTAAPTVYRAMRYSPSAHGKGTILRRLSSAGEPLTPEVNAWSIEHLGLSVRDHYGQTEVGMIFANLHHPELEREVVDGSMGPCLPGWSAAVVAVDSEELLPPGNVGRIAIDARDSLFMTFTNYQDPSQTASRFTRDGRYYLLGDLGSVDDEGYFRFSSRDDDVIIMAGYRIGPFEIESVISQHPDVSECAVIAAPDPDRGEVLEVFVVLKPETRASIELAKSIQALVKTQYGAHAYPRAVHFADSLPKTPSGKIQRFLLRQQRRTEGRSEQS